MKITILIGLLIGILNSNLFAQNDSLNKRYKIFVNGFYTEYKDKDSRLNQYSNQLFISNHSDFSLGFLSISREKFLNNGNSNEIEILPFKISNFRYIDSITKISTNQSMPVSGSNIFSVEIKIRYQYNFNFNNFNKNKLNPFIGISSYYFINYFYNIPLISTTYRTANLITGIGFSVIPGLSYKIKPNILFELNIPYQIYEIYYIGRKDFNPIYSRSESITKNIENIFFPVKYYLRLGVVYLL